MSRIHHQCVYRKLIWLLIIQIIFMGMVIGQESILAPCEQALEDGKTGVERTREMVQAIYPDREDVYEYYTCYYEYLADARIEGGDVTSEEVARIVCVMVLAVVVFLVLINLDDMEPIWTVSL